MKWCGECGAEHRDSAAACVFCGGPIVDERPEPAPVADPARHDVASVDISGLDAAQRSMLQMLLTSSGVHAEFRGDRIDVAAVDVADVEHAVLGVQEDVELDIDEPVDWHGSSVTDPAPGPTVAGRPVTGTGTRVGAWLLDLFITWIVTDLLGAAVRGLGGDAEADGWWVVGLVWVVQITLVGRFGWSPGKLVIGLRVIGADGAPPGWTRAAVRYVAQVGPFYAAIAVGTAFAGLGGPARAVAGSLTTLAMLWFPILLASIATGPAHQGLHDRIAGTYVVDR